jgi:glutamate N-acetyltransferase/amino-acid N-acetyltransferase
MSTEHGTSGAPWNTAEQHAEIAVPPGDLAGGITAARGYRAAGVHCGVKKAKKDLCLLVSDVPATGAAVLTTNRVQAAPVLVVRHQLNAGSTFRALVVNSGNANACTGERGMKDAWMMAGATARALGISPNEVLVSSTGVIGQFLPIDKIVAGIGAAALGLSPAEGTAAAEAIMTTDTFVKETAVRCELHGVPVTIGGMAKGSGMIAPNMATMLAFVTTDAAVAPALLHRALVGATNRSFNRISVDGDMSTNDMAVVLANGMSRATPLTDAGDPAFALFCHALEEVLVRLAKMIVMDGEGATKFIEINVVGAASEEAATAAARAIANSSLVKTAMHGEDANWGRILAAVGTCGIAFDPADTEIWFGDVPILRRNYWIDFSETAARAALEQKDIRVTVKLHQGEAGATFWTCDLSKEYVAINANYRT